jgi:TolB-like protein
MKLIKELQRRNVFKGALAYVVFSWLLLQIVSIVFPILQIAMAYQRWVFIALLIGFPIWLVISWIYEWTPEGIRATADAEEAQPPQPQAKTRSARYIIFGLTLALALLLADKAFNLTDSVAGEGGKLSTIAVLPFTHQSASEEDTFFTEGVHEDLMTRLAGVKEFRIMSKSSVLPYREYEGDLKEVGRKLNADFIMQGSVRRWQDEIRISIQFIESQTDQVVWSHEYNGRLENLFALQADIATVISEKLQANLSLDEARELEAAPTENLAAYDDYLRARNLLNQPRASYEDITTAIALLENAVKADAGFVKAWALLVTANGEAYNQLSKLEGQEARMQEVREASELALEKAKSLAPSSWDVLSEEGVYYMLIEKDPLKALKAFEQALEQNPSDVLTMRNLSQLYVSFGELDKALDILERAFTLTQTNGFISYGLSFIYELKGEYGKMVPFLERLAELYPEQKHYLVEAAYYKFLESGSQEAFESFRQRVETSNAENPWDERAIKNMEMTVAMFSGEFDAYHRDWKGKHQAHIADHGDWMCPLVANDFINQSRLLLEHQQEGEAAAILEEVRNIVLKPINPNSVCVFNPQVYLPKVDFLSGEPEVAAQKIEALALPVLQNESFPLGAVERSVLLQAVDLILPEKVYYYYEQVVKQTISMTSFESICADPWNYPNLIKDPRFIAEIRQDGRFVDFLQANGFL